MKKLIIVFGLVAIFGNTRAQSPNPDDAKKKKIDEMFYFYFGVGPSTVTSDGASANVGGQIGFGTTIYSFSKSFDINAGLVGSFQGAKYNGYSYSVPTDTGGYYPPSSGSNEKLKLFYLGIPIMARYKFGSGFYAEAGLQPSFLLSAKYKSEGSSSNYKDNMNTFDLGIPFGAGYYFSKHLSAGVRLIPGVTNISKSSPGYEYGKSHHNFLGIAKIGYSF